MESEKLKSSTFGSGVTQEKKANIIDTINLVKGATVAKDVSLHGTRESRDMTASLSMASRGPPGSHRDIINEATPQISGDNSMQSKMKEILRNKILAKKLANGSQLGTSQITSQPLRTSRNQDVSAVIAQRPTKSDELKPKDVPNFAKKQTAEITKVEKELPMGLPKGELKQFKTSLENIKNEQTDNSEDEQSKKKGKSHKDEPSELEIPEIKPKPMRNNSRVKFEDDQPHGKDLNKSVSDQTSLTQKQHESGSLKSSRGKLKRLTSGDYDKMVATVKGLDMANPRLFALRAIPENRIIQCTIFRDKSGLINKFYPIFHLYFTVS